MVYPSGDAPWTTDASTLCRSLRDSLGPSVVFRRFRWSGRNSHTARLSAAGRLRDYLEEGLLESPEATHIVVAHSHGGNVALMAVEDSNLCERIAGVACLATPFISVRERDIGRDLWASIRKASLVLLASVAITLSFLFLGPLRDNLETFLKFLGLAAVAYCLLFSVFVLLRRRAREHATRLCRELTPRLPEKDHLLIVRSPADEASGALAIFQFLSQLTVRLFLFSESLYVNATHLIHQPRKLLPVGFSALAVSLAFYFIWAVLDQFHAAFWLQMLAIAGFMCFLLVFDGAILLVLSVLVQKLVGMISPWTRPENPVLLSLSGLLSAMLWLVIALLSLLLVIPFGWQAAVANILLDVTAENTPPGSWEIHLIEPPTSEELGGAVPPSMHSVYENPRVQRKLAEWIKRRGLAI